MSPHRPVQVYRRGTVPAAMHLINTATPLASVAPLPCCSAIRPLANLSDLAPSIVFRSCC